MLARDCSFLLWVVVCIQIGNSTQNARKSDLGTAMFSIIFFC